MNKETPNENKELDLKLKILNNKIERLRRITRTLFFVVFAILILPGQFNMIEILFFLMVILTAPLLIETIKDIIPKRDEK